MSKHDFHRNFAIIIGINNYQNSIRELITAVPDALKLAEIVQKQHEKLKPQYQAQNKYEVQLLLNQRASLSQLQQLITDFKQGQITLDREKVTVTESDRLLFYFAGHGIALDALENQEGPVGYLIPQDAISGDSSTYLPMQELHDALNALPCRHMLAILDCCFAGALRWASLKREVVRKVQIYKERYDRFISDRAWQVITSAADDQKALDSLGSRGRVTDGNEVHSPFAQALFDVLLGKGGDLNQDGMVTATELYSYLRDQVEIASENYYQRQTPSLCPLRKHDKGEFIFLLPDFDRDKLSDAPPLNVENNPYRGLSSYDEKDSHLFFGREEQIQKLYQKVVDNKQQLTLVLGASGTGKSSLVKAGLIPKLRKDDKTWRILPPFRPGESPLKSLNNVLESVKQPLIEAGTSSRLFTPAEESLGNWFKNNPQAKLLVIIDQFEELITLSKSEEAEKFQIFIKKILAKYPNNIHVVITLRLDFEAQFQTSVLKDFWNDEARFVVSPMNQNEFRQAIEKPALEKVLYFDPPSLVDELINEVVQMPGALPLLSFTLSELYLKYLGDRTRDNRALTKKDYEELGRVVGSLTKRANQEYEKLVAEDSAYQDTVRRVMLRMISLQGSELVRRQVPKSELVYANEEENKRVQTVIKRFSEARLIVEGSNSQDKPYVEPAHDALVQGWDKLLEWKKADEENLILQRLLTPAAVDWASHKSARFLWNANPRLDLLKQVLNSKDNWLNKVEAEFVRRSVGLKSFNTRRNWSIAITVIVGLSGLAITAVWQWRDAKLNEIEALNNLSNSLFVSGQELDALMASVKAGITLKQINWLKADDKTQDQATKTLHEVISKIKEVNRWSNINGKISLSPNGEILASVDNKSGTIQLWGLDGKLLKSFSTSSKGSAKLTWSPNSEILALSSHNTNKTSTTLWNKDGQLLKTFPPISDGAALSFSPDSNYLVIQDEHNDNSFSLWSVDGRLLRTFNGHDNLIYVLSWSPDGQIIASGSKDNTVRLWSINGKLLKTLPSPRVDNKVAKGSTTGNIWSLAWDFSGEILAAGGNDGTIQLWDRNGELIANLRGHIAPIRCLNWFDKNSFNFVSGSEDGTLKVWDGGGGWQYIKSLQLHSGKEISDIYLLPISEGKSSSLVSIISSGGDNTVRLWNFDAYDAYSDANPDANSDVLLPDVSKSQWNKNSYYDLNNLLIQGCNRLHNYLENNSNVSESDRHLCDDVPPITTNPEN